MSVRRRLALVGFLLACHVAVAAQTPAPSAPAALPVPTLAAVLTRAGDYADAYEQRFSLLVAEEDYYQRADRPAQASFPGSQGRTTNPAGSFGLGTDRARRLRSDYLLVRNGEGGWLPFRDVFEVDGRRVRDREDRMVKLLLTPSPDRLAQAGRIMAESTRYNLGRVTRTINIPTLAVLLVRPGIRPRLRFAHQATSQVAGRTAWVLAYEEQVRPTLVQTPEGGDLPMRGEIWVDPTDGTVLKTEMSVADTTVIATVTVEYRDDTALGMWVPAAMTEHYRAPMTADEIRCTATYSNFRRFSVQTDEAIGGKKGGRR